MEPKLPRPNLSPEIRSPETNIQPEIPSKSIERSPEMPSISPEKGNVVSDDSALQAATQAATTISIPSPPKPQPSVATNATDDDNPTVANDDDRIEKEWVDKAKKVVAETREDPHKQSHEVSKMQADYLNKRFGKQMNLPNDS